MQSIRSMLAMESDAKNPNLETEIVVYAKITDAKGLNQAVEIIEQEQLDGTIGDGQKCRVRKETKDGKIEYTFTYKIKMDHDGINQFIEHTAVVDEAFFQDFSRVAKKRVKKTRYVFDSTRVVYTGTLDGANIQTELPKVRYEVDVYQNQEGQDIAWCKIDVEVDAINRHLEQHYGTEVKDAKINIKYSHLPFKPVEMIINSTTDPEQKKFLSELWEQHYNLPL